MHVLALLFDCSLWRDVDVAEQCSGARCLSCSELCTWFKRILWCVAN